MSVPADVERVWREFWAPIVMKRGKLSLSAVKRELFDFHTVMGEVPKVYDHVTGGRISKIMTDARAVIDQANAHYQNMYEDDNDYF